MSESELSNLENETIQAVNILTEFVDSSQAGDGERTKEKVLKDREACIQALIAAAKVFNLHVVGRVKM